MTPGRRPGPVFRLAILALFLFLPGCSGRFPADSFAEQNGFTDHVAEGETFDVRWFLRGGGEVLRVYIEGDGLAWLTPRRPSSDPTPREAAAFRLAASDAAPAVAYLARPCQFVEGDARRGCSPVFWTSARFSEPVIRDMDAALGRAKRASGASALELVGYSGGGAVALLTAARRNDVRFVVTVAGNLDHAFWTRLHRVSPLRGSLNPADFADRLRGIRQVHLAGGEDDVVPPAVAESYLRRLGEPDRVRLVVVPGADHSGGWERALRSVLEGLK